MSLHKQRVRLIQALIAGNPAISSNGLHSTIQTEFFEAYQVCRVRSRQRRHLLQVVHITRALDSALSVFIDYHGCTSKHSLGGYLWSLARHQSASLNNQLLPQDRRRFQNSIVDIRNRFLHEAGSYPTTDDEINTLLAEMQDCLVVVFRL